MFAEQVPGFSFTTVEDGMEYKVVEVPQDVPKKCDPEYMKHFNVFVEVGKGERCEWAEVAREWMGGGGDSGREEGRRI